MGMLATVINSLGLSSALGAAGVKARVLTAIRMEPIGEFYNKWKAIEAMENGEVVIMSAGTGNPFFYYRYRVFPAWYRDRSRCDVERNTRGRHLYS